MSSHLKRALFGCFVLSGFSGLVYQIVWVRMALAYFGVITPFASVVISVFMLGLALGTWAGGRYASPLARRIDISPLSLYACCELVIGLGAFVLPLLFELGRRSLFDVGMNSGEYLLLSSVVITVAMLPWCICMGATFPTMMAFIEETRGESSDSFSFLYLANVIGAMLGAISTSVFLIELLGFRSSLSVAAGFNLTIALTAFAIARSTGAARAAAPHSPPEAGGGSESHDLRDPHKEAILAPLGVRPGLSGIVLFVTGFTSMGLEIVWMRAFTPILGTLVYAFSGLLTAYLFATWLGSYVYRRDLAARRRRPFASLVCWLAPAVTLPVLVSIPGNLIGVSSWLLEWFVSEGGISVSVIVIALTLLSIVPFCALLGYLTPMLIDHESGGAPERAGRVYAINIAGSILGPLAAAYLLLPSGGARLSMILLASPFVLLFVGCASSLTSARQRVAFACAGSLTVAALINTGLYGRSFEEGGHLRDAVVRRDHTATVISHGSGMGRHLLVNGYGMTVLHPLTKVMAHLPLASLDEAPKSAAVIAFGMGTTFRSLLSWPIEVTAVELVPSVVEAFGYYHDDAEATRQDPRAHIHIDDGRRYLARTNEIFDVITIDPPPPVETAGSSLLYAEEFYAIAKSRLRKSGILMQWFPDGIDVEPAIRHAVLRAVTNSFDHVRVFQSLHGRGLHLLCSNVPIHLPTASEFAQRMPLSARRDLMEWAPPRAKIEDFIQTQILDKELDLADLLDGATGISLTDDRPINEYFVVRRLLGGDGR